MLLAGMACAFSGEAFAQKTVRGVVTDAETGETLPSTNISIEETYRGTITNQEGRYSLTIADSLLPARLRVRFLGYETEYRTITRESAEVQDFRLRPAVQELGEIVVSGEDPAIRIMREVIRRKQVWREKLETYRAEAYTRQTLSNDTSIVMISETASTAYWDHQRGHREVVRSRRQTANIEESQNFAGVSYVPNFYDDNIEIAGFDVVGVTHPDALDYYDFEVVDQTQVDDRTVYEIRVIPERRLQPLFEGTVFVLDEEYAMLEVRLTPNDVVTFPPPVRAFESSYEQQFDNYGKAFWLPVDVRIEGEIKISMIGLRFPWIRFRQVARITDYEVNGELPDSLYRESGTFTVDSSSADEDTLRVRALEPIPLSKSEQRAYETVDSTATLEEAFRPTGFLVELLDLDLSVGGEEDGESSGGDSAGAGEGSGDFDLPGSLTPELRFNRVDELYAGARWSLQPTGGMELWLNGGYSTGYRESGYGGGLSYRFSWGEGFYQGIGAAYRAGTETRFESPIYSEWMTMVPNLLGARNYFDYYRREGWELSTTLAHAPSELSLEAGFRSERHRSLPATSAYDLLGRENAARMNTAVDEGRVRSIHLSLAYNRAEDYTFGITGLRRALAGLEYSAASLGSDFRYSRLHGRLEWNFDTFYRRRILPNTLDLVAGAGTAGGELPIQRLGTVDGSLLGIFSPFGTLKTLRNRPYEGRHYLSLSAEHNFRTVPFELLGLDPLVERNWGLIAFGGVARTWLPEDRMRELDERYGYVPRLADPIHLEAGISVNGILGLFRVDLAQRLDRPAFMVNLSVARYF